MSPYEIVSVVTALLAISISLYTIISQRRLHRENIELQRVTAELARKQLESLSRDDALSLKAFVKADLVKFSSRSYKFVISNIGRVDAHDVVFELLDPATSPLIDSECKEKMPAPKLSPGSSFSLIAAMHMQSPRTYRGKLTWKNPDGSVVTDDVFLSL